MPARTLPLFVLSALCVALGLPTEATAQPAVPPKIDKVRIGLPTGIGDGGRMRQGAWTPVYITLKASDAGNGQQQFKLVLDAQDLEDNPYHYTVPVPALVSGTTEVVFGYLRSPNQDFTITLETIDGKLLETKKQQRAIESEPLKPNLPLFVVMGGSNLPKLKSALLPDKQGDGAETEELNPRGYARISTVNDMPDRWFGYDAVDVVVLTTNNDTFMADLTASTAATRRKALAEWVRRGGRLVLSVGRNHQFVNSLLASMPLPEVDKMPLVPFEITGSVQRKSLPSVNTWAKLGPPSFGLSKPNGVEVATLALGSERSEKSGLGDGTNVLLYENPEAPQDKGLPLIVQSSCGLGRVLLVAFDLDASPFSDWIDARAKPGDQPERKFWVQMRKEITSNLFDPNEIREQENKFQERDRPEILEELQRHIDTFDEVPVVSFGWVALFIFFYILVVGPLDYVVLKKVFKRLELTWITFPTVVVTISIGAYFIAYALKGDDLRINKIDLVEIDLHTPQAYGTSWFSVFSPRMQNYTIGVDPIFQSGPAGGLAPAKASTTLAVLENPTVAAHGGSTSLFRQPYVYAEDAAGIKLVPIPVWSTCAFTASWRTGYSSNKPLFRADLTLKNGIVTGQIINEMPVELQDVCLFYHDRWYQLSGRTLAANGDLYNVANLEMGGAFGKGDAFDKWFDTPILASKRPVSGVFNRNDWRSSAPVQPSDQLLKHAMFFRGGTQTRNLLNNGMRNLNQNWRLSAANSGPPRDEVILVARTAFASGKAAKINDDSLVQLWNDQLPGSAETCPPLSGFLSQETYIRVYIPVKNQ